MYMFSRVATLGGNPRKAIAWAVETAAYVSEKCGRTVATRLIDFGRPVGSVAWTTTADSLADLNTTFAPLMEDDGYYDLIDRGAEFTTSGLEDHLREVVRPPADTTPPAVGSMGMLITAVAANGKLAEAMAWGAEMAAYVESVNGLPSTFLADAYGDFGRVTWIGSAPDAAAIDAANAKLNNDPGYVQRLSQVGDLFLAGSGRSLLSTRIA